VDGIHHWIRQTLQTPTSTFPPYSPLIQSHASIGWGQLLLGH
jgi:hypothetical protein